MYQHCGGKVSGVRKNLVKTKPKIEKVRFGSQVISFSLHYSSRKTLAINVHPDTSVSVIAPTGQKIDAIKGKVLKRGPWILKQRRFFSRFLPRQPDRRFVSGETHRYLGRQYRLKVLKGTVESVSLRGRYLCATLQERTNSGQIKALLTKWYRDHAEVQFQGSLECCLDKFRRLQLSVPTIKLKRMSKRWGSCTKGGIIYLNPDLVKAPKQCIDYVMTHELCHLKHRSHDKDYYRLLTKLMPDWEERKQKLELVSL